MSPQSSVGLMVIDSGMYPPLPKKCLSINRASSESRLLQGTSKNLGTSPNLCFSPLASLNKMGNSGAITHSITPCYEQKSTSLGSHEVFRGALHFSTKRRRGACAEYQCRILGLISSSVL